MSDTTLLENSMFSDATKRAAIVADAPLCTSLFFINYLGFLGLYALNDSRGFMKNYEQSEKKLKINEIADDNHDVSLVVKLCVEAGVANESQVAQVTKLLALIKQRSIRAKDLDSVRVRELIEKTMLHNKPMSQFVKTAVTAFMTGAIDLKEYARQIYDVSKTNTFRDYTLEFRTLVVKGQYTDYFTVMKRGGAVSAPAGQAGGVRTSAVKTAVAPAAPPADKVDETVKEFVKHWVATKGVFLYFANQWFTNFNAHLPIKNRVEFLQKVVNAVPDATFVDFPLSVPANVPASEADLAYMIATRQCRLAAAKNDWNSCKGVPELLFYSPAFSGMDEAKATIGKIAIEGIKTHPTPSNDAQWNSWIRVAHIAWSCKMDAEMEALKATVKPKDTNHNVHLLTLPTGKVKLASTNVKLVDPSDYGAKALAWIRKWGPAAGNGNSLISLRFTTAMTSTVWKAMSADDQAIWMSQNFNRAGADKSDAWMNRENRPSNYSYMKISAAAREMVISNIGNAWKDGNIASSFMGKGHRHRWLSIGAIAVADIMLKEKRAVMEAPEEYRNYIANSMFSTTRRGNATDLKAWPSPEITALLASIDISDAPGVQKLIELGNSLSETGFFHVTHFGNTTKAIGMEMMAQVAFAASSRINGIDTSSTHVQIDNDALTPEAVDWVQKFGKMFARPVLLRAPAIVDPEVAADYFVIGTATDELSSHPVEIDDSAVREVLSWSADKWTQVAARVAASGKHDMMFQYANTRSYNMGIKGLNSDLPGEFMKGMRTFVMSNYGYKELKNFSSTWTSVVLMPVPVKKDLVEWAAEQVVNFGYGANTYMSSWRGMFDFNNDDRIVEVVNSIIDQGFLGPKTTIFVTNLIGNLTLRLDANKARIASIASNLAQKAGDDFRPVLASIMGPELMAVPELHEATRWAVPVTAADVSTALKETQAAGGGFYGAYRTMAFDIKFAPSLSIEWQRVYNEGRGYNDKAIPVAPWADSMSDEELAPDFSKLSQYDFLQSSRIASGSDRMKEAFKKAFLKALDAPTLPWANDVSGGKTAGVIEAMELIGIDDIDVKKKYVQGSLDVMLAAKGSTPSDFATFVDEVDTALLSTAQITALVKKFASTDSKVAISALASLAYDNNSKTVNPDFISAVRAAGNERAVISRLAKTLEVGSALDIINADPNGVPIQIDKARIDKFLKFNNVDMSKSVKVSVTRLEDFGTAKAQVSAVVPPLAMVEVKGDDVRKDRIKMLHKANRYNHSPALGLEVKRTFAVNLPGQKDRFDAWCKANPTTKILTLYHGTGTINAAFILRFGFKIIASTDPSVTGRMLGDGIYFADNINKTMLYMSNSGYIRQDGQEGYVLKCLVALGQRPRNHREGNAERSGLVSNEWAVFSTDQILIQEAYYGVSREQKAISSMLNEAVRLPAYNVSTFMFMDGMVPVDKTMLVDFEALSNLGKHVSIETSAKGPVVTIRHDTTVRPVHQCYRWGEEMQSAEHAKSLALFLKLLKNTY